MKHCTTDRTKTRFFWSIHTVVFCCHGIAMREQCTSPHLNLRPTRPWVLRSVQVHLLCKHAGTGWENDNCISRKLAKTLASHLGVLCHNNCDKITTYANENNERTRTVVLLDISFRNVHHNPTEPSPAFSPAVMPEDLWEHEGDVARRHRQMPNPDKIAVFNCFSTHFF